MNVLEMAKSAGITGYDSDIEFFVSLVRAEALEEAAKRADAYAYMSDNFNVLAAEIRGLK